MFTDKQLKVIEYCIEEVKRQGDTPDYTNHMLKAWNYAEERFSVTSWPFDMDFNPTGEKIGEHKPIDLPFIETIGKLVDPIDNDNGFRTTRVGVGNGIEWIEKTQPERVIPNLSILIDAYYAGNLDPDELRDMYKGNEQWGKYKYYKKAETPEDVFYFEFEEIHPFRDGNGRTGKILYNYLSGTLDDPIWPPNFWNVSNP